MPYGNGIILAQAMPREYGMAVSTCYAFDGGGGFILRRLWRQFRRGLIKGLISYRLAPSPVLRRESDANALGGQSTHHRLSVRRNGLDPRCRCRRGWRWLHRMELTGWGSPGLKH